MWNKIRETSRDHGLHRIKKHEENMSKISNISFRRDRAILKSLKMIPIQKKNAMHFKTIRLFPRISVVNPIKFVAAFIQTLKRFLKENRYPFCRVDFCKITF